MTANSGVENPNRPRNILDAIKKSWRDAKVQAGHMTGRYGYDPVTGLPVAEPSSQPIQAARDMATRTEDAAGGKKK